MLTHSDLTRMAWLRSLKNSCRRCSASACLNTRCQPHNPHRSARSSRQSFMQQLPLLYLVAISTRWTYSSSMSLSSRPDSISPPRWRCSSIRLRICVAMRRRSRSSMCRCWCGERLSSGCTADTFKGYVCKPTAHEQREASN